MTPISRGGVDFIENIVPACLRCNQLKSDSTVEEFRSQRAWVIDRKSTGNTMYGAEHNFPQSNASGTVEILSPGPVLPTVELAAMWKKVLDKAASQKTIDGERQRPEFWQQRRDMLKRQAEGMKRMQKESAGQMTLPIFGDNSSRIPPTDEAALVLNGMHVSEPMRRKA